MTTVTVNPNGSKTVIVNGKAYVVNETRNPDGSKKVTVNGSTYTMPASTNTASSTPVKPASSSSNPVQGIIDAIGGVYDSITSGIGNIQQGKAPWDNTPKKTTNATNNAQAKSSSVSVSTKASSSPPVTTPASSNPFQGIVDAVGGVYDSITSGIGNIQHGRAPWDNTLSSAEKLYNKQMKDLAKYKETHPDLSPYTKDFNYMPPTGTAAYNLYIEEQRKIESQKNVVQSYIDQINDFRQDWNREKKKMAQSILDIKGTQETGITMVPDPNHPENAPTPQTYTKTWWFDLNEDKIQDANEIYSKQQAISYIQSVYDKNQAVYDTTAENRNNALHSLQSITASGDVLSRYHDAGYIMGKKDDSYTFSLPKAWDVLVWKGGGGLQGVQYANDVRFTYGFIAPVASLVAWVVGIPLTVGWESFGDIGQSIYYDVIGDAKSKAKLYESSNERIAGTALGFTQHVGDTGEEYFGQIMTQPELVWGVYVPVATVGVGAVIGYGSSYIKGTSTYKNIVGTGSKITAKMSSGFSSMSSYFSSVGSKLSSAGGNLLYFSSMSSYFSSVGSKLSSAGGNLLYRASFAAKELWASEAAPISARMTEFFGNVSKAGAGVLWEAKSYVAEPSTWIKYGMYGAFNASNIYTVATESPEMLGGYLTKSLGQYEVNVRAFNFGYKIGSQPGANILRSLNEEGYNRYVRRPAYRFFGKQSVVGDSETGWYDQPIPAGKQSISTPSKGIGDWVSKDIATSDAIQRSYGGGNDAYASLIGIPRDTGGVVIQEFEKVGVGELGTSLIGGREGIISKLPLAFMTQPISARKQAQRLSLLESTKLGEIGGLETISFTDITTITETGQGQGEGEKEDQGLGFDQGFGQGEEQGQWQGQQQEQMQQQEYWTDLITPTELTGYEEITIPKPIDIFHRKKFPEEEEEKPGLLEPKREGRRLSLKTRRPKGKGLMSDLLSVTRSHALYGKATQPRLTKKLWAESEKSLFKTVPTQELMTRGRRFKNLIGSDKLSGDLIGKGKNKKTGGKKNAYY